MHLLCFTDKLIEFISLFSRGVWRLDLINHKLNHFCKLMKILLNLMSKSL